MSFFKPAKMMKKRFKFQVTLFLEELCSVPFVTGSLHCKVRLRDGGSFTENTNWSDVQNHTVVWKKKFVFQCKMSANPTTGILETCVLRISIRKESKGGKGAVKVGLVDLNLAEYAGSNHTTRHCLLEPYQEKNRLDNSLLKVIIGLHLLSGDPCFKIPRPTMRDVTLPLPDDAMNLDRREGSESSGFGSLSRKSHKPLTTSQTNSNESGHSRNTSSASQHSKFSDSDFKNSSTPNSTSLTSSPGEREPGNNIVRIDGVASPHRNHRNAPPPRPPPPRDRMRQPLDLSPDDRMGVTRVSANDIVDGLIADQDFTSTSATEEDGGLRLYVASDGTTALGGQSFYNRGGNTMFQQVVIDPSQSVPKSSEAIANRS